MSASVILNSTTDRPWSHYYLLYARGQRRLCPRTTRSATKRVLRAILKAADLCAAEPERVARQLIDGGFPTKYEYALQDAERICRSGNGASTTRRTRLRFYALRLHEVGMIKSSPNQLIAEGTDWRFLNELKRELKA